MALITITIRDDEENGKVDISLQSEPPLHIENEKDNTDAQWVALRMLTNAIGDEEDVEVTAS